MTTTREQKHQHTRVRYLDSLRAIAVVAVLVLHASAGDWYQVPVESTAWQTLNVLDSAVRFCVPVFFMISGAMFLDPNRAITPRAIFTKYLPRIAIPFMAWSLLYAAISTFGPGGDRSISGFASRAIVGHYHLWFLIALAGLYLATPLLRPLAADRRLGWYFIALAVPFALVLPHLTRPPFTNSVISGLLGAAQFELVLGYSVYFVLGHLLHSAPSRPPHPAVLIVTAAIGIAVTALGTSVLSRAGNTGEPLLYGYLTPNVFVVAVAIFLLAKRSPGLPHGKRPLMAVTLLARHSFGIYLVHPLFQTIYQHLGLTGTSTVPVLAVPMLTVAMLIPSLLTAVLLARIPKVGRFLV